MKRLLLILLFAVALAASLHAQTPTSWRRAPAPPTGRVAESLLWVADTRKMDIFLNYFDLADVHEGSYAGEVLPDTRTAWRDYAIEAMILARRGKDAEAAAKLAQMLKLAAVYRSFGGLQNVVQGEEIAYLAGRTAERLGKTVTSLIQSPYLEKDAADCLTVIETQAGGEKERVTPSFWRQLEMRAVETHYRLTAAGGADLSAGR